MLVQNATPLSYKQSWHLISIIVVKQSRIYFHLRASIINNLAVLIVWTKFNQYFNQSCVFDHRSCRVIDSRYILPMYSLTLGLVSISWQSHWWSVVTCRKEGGVCEGWASKLMILLNTQNRWAKCIKQQFWGNPFERCVILPWELRKRVGSIGCNIETYMWHVNKFA